MGVKQPRAEYRHESHTGLAIPLSYLGNHVDLYQIGPKLHSALEFCATRFTLACLLLFPLLKHQKIELPKGRDAWNMILITAFCNSF